ncbi:hypothetical protein C1646_747795 [Rhizophagus diaphanus]|nr:hypothetical protein C1646_747795 [Rhizophagus diaphanus] [Rhizophagus sp. MUCL 43196]
MNDSDKWILSTGKIVEDVLYNFGIKCRHEHLCHSFVIDPNDNIYIDEEVFTETELDEIREYKLKPMPQMPQDLLTYLNSFRVSDISSLRNAIFKSQKWDSPYNRQTYFDHDWIRNTAYNLWVLSNSKLFLFIPGLLISILIYRLHKYEAGSLEKDHLELWLLVHVWNFVDRGFGNVNGLETARSESSSRASSNRNNRNRTGSAIGQNEEKDYGKAWRSYHSKGNNGTKLLHERGIKAPKMMKDMFYSLCEAVGNEEKKIRKLQSIGFIHSGLMILLLRLVDSPAGYTCRITRTKMLEIPSQITQFGSKVLPVIVLAWKAKMIVKSNDRPNIQAVILTLKETISSENVIYSEDNKSTYSSSEKYKLISKSTNVANVSYVTVDINDDLNINNSLILSTTSHIASLENNNIVFSKIKDVRNF